MASPAPGAFDLQGFRLSGTFAVGPDQVAVIASEREPGAPQRLYHVGDLLGDARIVSIGLSRVQLASSGRTLALELRSVPSATSSTSSAATTATTR